MADASTNNRTARVSLVIPGRNCQRTVRQCLGSVVAMLDDPHSPLAEIIFVDDGSTDETPKIVRSFERVNCIRERGRGPGAARNAGWRAAQHPLIWFIDADCVAEPDALTLLLPHMDDATVGGVSGSYGIMNEHALLARLIHEEIVARHAAMRREVNFLATFNVLYRRAVLEQVGGFDERYAKAQDAELAFRVQEAGSRLRFEPRSRVKHFHPEQLLKYLRTQRQHGYWRVLLHLEHRGHALGDSYSSAIDHLQPPLAVLALASLALPLAALFASHSALNILAWGPVAMMMLLLVMQIPMTTTMLRRSRSPAMLLFAPLGVIRAVWRGVGMAHGTVHHLLMRPSTPARRSANRPPACDNGPRRE